MTNGCWVVHKQLGLPLRDTEKVNFQKRESSQKKQHKMYNEEVINTMISENVEAMLKANKNDPKQTDDSDTESVNMEEFNNDPASDSEHE